MEVSVSPDEATAVGLTINTVHLDKVPEDVPDLVLPDRDVRVIGGSPVVYSSRLV